MYPAEIFKAYDIRGIVDETLTPALVRDIGQAIGSEALARQQRAVVIGRDGRLSGSSLAQALANGLQAAGIDVIDIGCVATPMTYFAAHHLQTHSAVMVTGSHNPPKYNGLKMMLGGETLAGEAITQLRHRLETGQLSSGYGSYSTYDIQEEYLHAITSTLQLQRPMNIVIDCGNGVAGSIAPTLYRRLGCKVRELFCDVDGNFPNHHPDPSRPENLIDLKHALEKTDAEIGLAFDGDGDRLGVVTKSGKIIFPDRQLLLFAADVLARNPGATVIYDVKSTGNLAPWIRQHGGIPLLCRTGHSFIKAKMRETGALIAGEMSGHLFFKERWFGFDDGVYAGARLLEILSRTENPSAILEALPDAVSTPEINLPTTEGKQHALITHLQTVASFPNAEAVNTLDGLRVEYTHGFGLIRASNTTPVLVLRFEAKDSTVLAQIQTEFRQMLQTFAPELNTNW